MLTAKQIADEFNGQIIGEEKVRISSIKSIKDAEEGSLSYISESKYYYHLKNTKASIILVPFAEDIPDSPATLIKVKSPTFVFTMVLQKWVKENNLSKGDNIFFEIGNNDLNISCDKKEKIEKCVIDLTGLDKISALHYIQSKYRLGFDEIEIIYEQNEVRSFHIKEESTFTSLITHMAGRFVGLEIVEQKSNRILLKRITKDDNNEFDKLLRRIFLLLKTTTELFVESIKINDINSLKEIKPKHDYINNLTNYCLRIINTVGLENGKNNIIYYHIISQIDKIIDILKYVSDDIIWYDIKSSTNSNYCLDFIKESVDIYCNLFYKFSTKDVEKLNLNRWKIKKYIISEIENLTKYEISNLTRLEGITEILLDITESRLGMEK